MHLILHRFMNRSTSMFREARARYRRIVRPQVIRHRGIWVPVGTISETARQSLYSGYYENLEVNMLQEKLDPSDRVVEFGSGLGVTATACAKICGLESTFTYEPNSEFIPLIKKIFDINNVNPTLYNAAVAKEPGEVEVFVSEDFFQHLFTSMRIQNLKYMLRQLNLQMCLKRFSQPLFSWILKVRNMI